MYYLTACNTHFPFHAQLWLWSMGEVPTFSWVISKLKLILGSNVANHSLFLGGVTALVLAGTPDDHIQAHGRWSLNAYHIYICKHPIMLQSLLHGCSAFNRTT